MTRHCIATSFSLCIHIKVTGQKNSLKLHRGLGLIGTDDEEREQNGEETATERNKEDTKELRIT